ncbi:MAG: hypothetical protein SFV54_26600 [Bryobacteraceae bacterium]|nr:hypothetical protein [Bryobacteraceae bacterium]
MADAERELLQEARYDDVRNLYPMTAQSVGESAPEREAHLRKAVVALVTSGDLDAARELARGLDMRSSLVCAVALAEAGHAGLVEPEWLKPDSPVGNESIDLWMNCGFQLELAGNQRAARHCYETVLKHADNCSGLAANAEYRLGLTLEALGDYSGATDHYRRSAEIAGRPFPAAQDLARFQLAKLLYLAEEYADSVRQLEQLQVGASLPAAYVPEVTLRLAAALCRLGNTEEAKRALVEWRARFPEGKTEVDVRIDLFLAETYRSEGSYGAARDCLRKVVENPAAAHQTRTRALQTLDRLPRS